MTFQIESIVLYSHTGKRRIIRPRRGQPNIITGRSKTGKSAITDIVEYCLGRGKCTIAEGPILEKVSWFLLRLQFPTTQVIVARPAPGFDQASTGQMYYARGENLELPDAREIHENSTSDAVEENLTRLLGISPNLNIPPPGQTRLPLEANIKHALFLVSQQQDEIASKKHLFHRASEPFIPQSIKDTLPYFLGAVAENRLATHQQLQRALRQLKVEERRLKEAELIAGEGISTAQRLLTQAREAGLLSPGDMPNEIPAVLSLLEPVRDWTPQTPTSVEGEQLASLQRERKEIRREYAQVSEEVERAKEFAREIEGFTSEAQEQQVRLQSLQLYKEAAPDEGRCPVCTNIVQAETSAVRSVNQAVELVSRNLAITVHERPKLREHVEALELRREQVKRRLTEKEQAIDGVLALQRETERLNNKIAQQAFIAGQVALYLENVKLSDGIGPLKDAVDVARREVERLEELLAEDEEEERLRFILTEINTDITNWARQLKLEHSEKPLFLDLKKLTLVADDGQKFIPLDRMGSGENWVGYHLVTYLALHKHFVAKSRPVPRLVILDQPTQVYFPRDRADASEGNTDAIEDDDDRVAVRRMFDLIFDICEGLDGELQIIIMDHADLNDERFQRYVLEKWWSGETLVPREWPDRQREPAEGAA